MANKDYSKVNAWMAEKCGVEFKIYGGSTYWKIPPTKDWRDAIPDWTIHDPRCREIIREKLCIHTFFNANNNWSSQSGKQQSPDDERPVLVGKTIAEAEIACIVAIWESEK